VYVRELDGACQAAGAEVRATARGATAPAGRVWLAARSDGDGWACAHVAHDERGGERVVLTLT
jgi:hypothetical protein